MKIAPRLGGSTIFKVPGQRAFGHFGNLSESLSKTYREHLALEKAPPRMTVQNGNPSHGEPVLSKLSSSYWVSRMGKRQRPCRFPHATPLLCGKTMGKHIISNPMCAHDTAS